MFTCSYVHEQFRLAYTVVVLPAALLVYAYKYSMQLMASDSEDIIQEEEVVEEEIVEEPVVFCLFDKLRCLRELLNSSPIASDISSRTRLSKSRQASSLQDYIIIQKIILVSQTIDFC